MEFCRLGIENTSGNPHNKAVSSSACAVSEMRAKWRIATTFNSTPCTATSEKNTNSAASDDDTKIAGTCRRMFGEYLPAMTVGKMALGRNVMETMNRLAKA